MNSDEDIEDSKTESSKVSCFYRCGGEVGVITRV